jgi:hypothetical protein
LFAGREPLREDRAHIVGLDGHFIGVRPLVCVDDFEAIAKAKRLVDSHDIELGAATASSFGWNISRRRPPVGGLFHFESKRHCRPVLPRSVTLIGTAARYREIFGHFLFGAFAASSGLN